MKEPIKTITIYHSKDGLKTSINKQEIEEYDKHPPKSKVFTPKTLHLVLKSKWYDKIASGKKTSEYREIKPYWNKRFLLDLYDPEEDYTIKQRTYEIPGVCFLSVIFSRGYTSETMEFEINSIHTTTEPNDLDLEKCWEIELGNRIK